MVISGEGECVYDLQDGDRDAYCAFRYDVEGGSVLMLFGSGWKACGWPIFREAGRYPGLRRKIMRDLTKELDAGRIPNFDSLWNGKLDDFVVLAKRD